MNHKNELQEYCQKKGYEFPQYTTSSKCCQDNSLLWFSVASVVIPDQSIIAKSGYHSNKKTAEKEAAKEMLFQLKSFNENQRTQLNASCNVVVYIDLENVSVPEMENVFNTTIFSENILFVGCLSVGHHHIDHPFQYDGVRFEKVVIPNTRGDACDIGMIMHCLDKIKSCNDDASKEKIGAKTECLIFVSRDRFSCVFIELANSGFCFDTKIRDSSRNRESNNMKILHASSISELMKHLSVELL